jgi:hypothetical protein
MYGRGWPWTLLSFAWARHAQLFYALWAGHPCNGLTGVSRVACIRDSNFYCLEHPMPYAFAFIYVRNFLSHSLRSKVGRSLGIW